jgi:signal transduction histidine kinase
MKLSQFINEHEEEILVEWETFAETMLPAAESMSKTELRDHGKQILLAIAKDIDTQQTSVQQDRKSQGLAGAADDSAASTHGTLRQVSGFTLLQLAAEYRALRATVLRLWLPVAGGMTDSVVNDMVRFNEAIDQALAESAMTYSRHAAVVRDTFLAILGHDLRSPLGTMTMAGDYLTQPSVGTDVTLQIGLRVKRSAATMNAMVNDLLEYARSQLSGEMPITRRHVDVRELCQAAINDVSSAHPDCPFRLSASGNLLGNFDGMRLHQVLSNLLNNAAQYRGKEHPVSISVDGKADKLVIEVQNFGPVIPPDSLRAVFDPLVQLPVDEQQSGRPTTSMGLGLFIASEITRAHGGSISVRSDEPSGTVFRVQLPHHSDAPVNAAGKPA